MSTSTSSAVINPASLVNAERLVIAAGVPVKSEYAPLKEFDALAKFAVTQSLSASVTFVPALAVNNRNAEFSES